MLSRPIINRLVASCGLFIALFALAACESDPTPIGRETGANEESSHLKPASAGDADYRLGANDRVRIIAFGQPTLTGEYTLDRLDANGHMVRIAATPETKVRPGDTVEIKERFF
jgi:hypothetical protein